MDLTNKLFNYTMKSSIKTHADNLHNFISMFFFTGIYWYYYVNIDILLFTVNKEDPNLKLTITYRKDKDPASEYRLDAFLQVLDYLGVIWKSEGPDDIGLELRLVLYCRVNE